MIRKIHLCLGTLFAPALIFFAFSGALQTLGLHESEESDATRPLEWIVAMASVHKDQHLPRPDTHKIPKALLEMRADEAKQHAHEAADAKKAAPEPTTRSQTLLKAFVVLMAIGLVTSAGLGIFIAVINERTRRTALVMLGIGLLLPIVLLKL